MSGKKMLIIGGGGMARVVIDCVRKRSALCEETELKAAGVLVDGATAGDSRSVCEVPVLGNPALMPALFRDGVFDGYVIAIGDNFSRQAMAERLAKLCPEARAFSVIHPSANIGFGSTIGPGSMVMPGVTVGPNCTIGAGCILNTHSSLDHDSVMAGYSSLAPRVATGGNVRIGARSAICIGAVISHGIEIGDDAVIGAGAVTLENVPGLCVAYGVPAKNRRPRRADERYL
jgi:sugar O-acyltransferase (sialic acid O-acetyltransferase NeuD family)